MNNKTRHLISFVFATIVYAGLVLFILTLLHSSKIEPVKTPKLQEIEISILDTIQPQISQKILHHMSQQTIQPIKQTSKPLENTNNNQQNQLQEKKIEEQKTTTHNIETTEKQQIIQKQVSNEPIKELQKIIEPTREIQTVKTIQKSTESIAQNVIQQSKTQPILQPISQKIQSPNQQNHQTITNDEANKKSGYFALIKQAINSHKYYPPNASRRGIEGDVKVKFTISAFGELVSILSIEGNSIFNTSIKEAIESAFPIAPPRNILHENTTLSLIISYKIN